jgi:hypothetical protein
MVNFLISNRCEYRHVSLVFDRRLQENSTALYHRLLHSHEKLQISPETSLLAFEGVERQRP